MKAGIKVGFSDGIQILEKTKAKYCEVWFRLDWDKKYTPLFQYCRENKVNFGLHFWATVDGKYFPNLLNLNDKITSKTYSLIKKTIDIASRWGAKYVNFHPESYRLNLLDLDKGKIKTLNLDEPIDREKSFSQLLFYLGKIKKYADIKGVIPFLETVPKYAVADFKNLKKGRLKPQKCEGLETERFFELGKMGFPLCLDIGHTLGQLLTEDKDELFNYLFSASQKMVDYIGLIHVTTNVSPFNGADSHHGILEQDFREGVVPNKEQLMKLFSLFKDRDVWLIPEPQDKKMIENYFALKKIVRKVEKE